MAVIHVFMFLIYGFNWYKPNNHLNLQLKMRRTSPLLVNSYPFSRENPFSINCCVLSWLLLLFAGKLGPTPMNKGLKVPNKQSNVTGKR